MMRNIFITLLSLSLMYSCHGQNTQQVNWADYLQPLEDQINELTVANKSLNDSLKLEKNNPLHDKFLSLRQARIAQHELIDSLKTLLTFNESIEYNKVLDKYRILLLQNDNLEKLQKGENKLVQIAQSIDELKENGSLERLQFFNNIKRLNLSDDLSNNNTNNLNFLQLRTSQLANLNFENSVINLIPRFTKRRKGSGHPEHDALQVSKYNCIYDSSDKYISLGDHRDKVIDLLGQPHSVMNYHKQDSTNYYLYYKHDNVLLHSDKVVGWDNRDNTLEIKLESSTEVDLINYISIGTSKCEVLALLGTPDELDVKTVERSRKLYNCHEKWGYGENSDYLCFSYKDEVMEYNNRDNSFDIRLKSSESKSKKDVFSIGSSMEDVVAIHGSPSELTTTKGDKKEHWNYIKGHKHAYIEFKNGKVVSVENRWNILNFKY